MAFLYEQDRGLTVIKDPYPHIGPGSYQNDMVQTQNAGYAPFMSTGDRVVPLVSKQKKIEPGPGSYEVSKPLGDSGVQAYMNKSTIIVKVQSNGTSAFRSNQDRFLEKVKQNLPGPGAYDWQPQQGRGFITEPPKGQIIEDIRHLNNQRKVQSIPQQKPMQGKKFLDIEQFANHQILVQQGMPTQGVNRLGPGSYEVQEIIGAKNKGTSWDKQKVKRFVDLAQTSVGPGKYNVNKRTVPRYKRNASPGFISETVRSHFDQLIYHTNSELKAELRKRTGYKDSDVPGPGQYTSSIQSIKVGQKSREFQFFGSSLERFKQTKDSLLGPGQYQLNNNSFDGLHRKKNYVNYSFMSTKGKDDSVDEAKPGPGSYNMNEHTLKQAIIKRFTLGYKGSFGSTEKRFDEKIDQLDVGPGKYEVNPDQSKMITAAFKSGTKRSTSEGVKRDCPTLGQYDVGQYNIATKMNKQANFLNNLKKIDVIKPGFDSAQPRFNQVANEITSNAQLMQDQSYTNDYKLYDPKSIKAPFISKSKRLDYLVNSQSPGVGQYQMDPNGWKKQSFNTHYNRILDDDTQ